MTPYFFFARGTVLATVFGGLSGGVTVAQGPLEAFVMVRIHAGQPTVLPSSGLMMIKSITLTTALSSIAVIAINAQLTRTTLGDPLLEWPFDESSDGQVTIYAGPGFGVGGFVQTWSFFDNDIGNGAVTPLLFEKLNDTDFVLRGMGASRMTYGLGIHTYSYDPEAGEPLIEPTFTFGFADRVAYVPEYPSTNPIVTASRNAGVIDFGYAEGHKWYFTSNGGFELRLGQIYRLGGITDSNIISLLEDANGSRSYSAQMSALGSRPALNATIHRAVEVCWPSDTNKQYQVQWRSAMPGGAWQDLGQPLRGNGSTNCVLDSTRHGEQRFYRVVIAE